MPQNAEHVFHARLERVEDGLWRASYRGELTAKINNKVFAEGAHVLTDTHIATDPDAARFFVEELARRQGFDRVVWNEEPPELISDA